MDFPKLKDEIQGLHYSHSTMFCSGKDEYIKSFIHKNYSINYHTHSFYELNIVLDGEGFHYIEELSCYAKKGCVFLIPPYVRHGYINKINLDVYHMLIHRDFIEKHFSEFIDTTGFQLLFETEPYLRGRYKENLFLILSEKELDNICTDITTIDTYKEMNHSELYINSVAKKILSHLCALISMRFGIEKVELNNETEFFSIAECLNYIHQNYDEKLTISFLADKLKMSRATFIRHFTKICNCSPHQYIQEYRLKKAREYIRRNNKNITEIAHKCGFYDASHLRKLLK